LVAVTETTMEYRTLGSVAVAETTH
jgi:hypothetical protein